MTKYHTIIIAVLVLAFVCAAEASSPVDEFTYLGPNDTSVRLDAFLHYLSENPTYRGQLIVYGAQNGKVGELKEHLRQLREYLVVFRKFDASRLVITNGGYREEIWFQLWGLPPKVEPVVPTPWFKTDEVRLQGNFRPRKLYKYSR